MIAKILICRGSFILFLFIASGTYSPAQSCADIPVHLSTNEALTRLQLVAALSKTLNMSIVAELTTSTRGRAAIPQREEATLMDYVTTLGDPSSIRCEIDNHVVHIYDANALMARANALNYVFDEFTVPDIADLFVIKFRVHLLNDAFGGDSSGLRSSSDTGAVSNDADRFKLPAAKLNHIKARDLLLREANIVPMFFAFEVDLASSSNEENTWRDSNKHLLFQVVR